MILFIKRKFSLDGRRGRDRKVVGFVAYHHLRCEYESRSWRGVVDITYMIKFVCGLRQVGGFLRILRFPPPIKLTTTI